MSMDFEVSKSRKIFISYSISLNNDDDDKKT